MHMTGDEYGEAEVSCEAFVIGCPQGQDKRLYNAGEKQKAVITRFFLSSAIRGKT
jgi:hypothetical protein